MIEKVYKILIASDNHGNEKVIDKLLSMHKDADLKIHCGDSLFDNLWCKKRFDYAVSGNNDFNSLPSEMVFNFQGINFYLCHGDNLAWNHQMSLKQLLQKTKREKCKFGFQGHLHMPLFEHDSSCEVFCPGSVSEPRSATGPTYLLLFLSFKNNELTTFNHVFCNIKS